MAGHLPGPAAALAPAPEPVLVASGVVKAFRHRSPDQPRTFRQWVERGLRGDRPAAPAGPGRVRALDDVGFEVAPGEMLGVIGRNGSGKSTLLRILGGVMQPDRGRVVRAAPPNAILELNAGMHPDLTGRENIVIGGVLAGLLRREVEARIDSIIAFAELERSIDDPVRTYSAGMKLRLGFAVAVHVEPRILLIDEVLSVGDLAFQQKCLARIAEFKRRGCAMVLVSHDLHQIATSCERALWLDRGRVRAIGPAEAVVESYTRATAEESGRRTPRDHPDLVLGSGRTLRAGENRFGSLEATVGEVTILGADGRPADTIRAGSALAVEAVVAVPRPIGPAHLSVSLASDAGHLVLDVSTGADGADLPPLADGTSIRVAFDRLDLAPGEYRLSVGLWHANWAEAYDFHQDVYPLTVTGPVGSTGPVLPPRRWSVRARP